MRELVNAITVQQGSNWKFDLTIYDDELYKIKYFDFIENNASLYSSSVKASLLLLLSKDLDQMVLKDVTIGIIGDVLDEFKLADLEAVFELVQIPNLTDKRVKIYFQIYKASFNSKTMKFNYEGTVLSGEGKLIFDIPATETQLMVSKTNRDYEAKLYGFYTIELQDTISLEVVRILEGDVIVDRGAKHESDL